MIRLDNIQYVGIPVEEEFANSTKAESEDSKDSNLPFTWDS